LFNGRSAFIRKNFHKKNNMTTSKPLTSTSKFLSLVLRHEPQRIGLSLDSAGWVTIDELLAKTALAGKHLSRDTLLHIVATCEKQRFALSEDGTRIRANQGHSVEVELGLPPQVPPDVLYHGTARRSLDAIRQGGLHRGARHHVHLTQQPTTAMTVGQRYGAPAILRVDARRMHQAGHVFFCTANQVWLCDAVPPEFIEVLP
jgi:putative RNA 2'-phosphotransferase